MSIHRGSGLYAVWQAALQLGLYLEGRRPDVSLQDLGASCPVILHSAHSVSCLVSVLVRSADPRQPCSRGCASWSRHVHYITWTRL